MSSGVKPEMEPISVKRIDKIFSDMKRKYLESREELRAKHRRKGKILIFVHELCECSNKRKMRQRFPEIERAETYNPRFLVGELIEEALKKRFKSEGDHVYTKELNINGKIYVISGMIDIIDPETKIPIEVKYQTFIQGKPYEHHILQLKLYLWLIDAERGELLYISPEGIKSYVVQNSLTDKDVVRLIEEEKSPRWPEWECCYCPYQQFCSKSNCERRRHKTFK